MFLLGHLGIGLGLAWLLAWKSPARFDYRLILFGAILPDVIDKPVGYILGLETRSYAHTFLFLFGIVALSTVPSLRNLRFVAFGVATHFLLDMLWATPRIVLFPAYGPFLPAAFDTAFWWDALLHNPYVQAGEIVGTAVLLVFAWANRVTSWRAVWDFLRHGGFPGTPVQLPLNKVN